MEGGLFHLRSLAGYLLLYLIYLNFLFIHSHLHVYIRFLEVIKIIGLGYDDFVWILKKMWCCIKFFQSITEVICF